MGGCAQGWLGVATSGPPRVSPAAAGSVMPLQPAALRHPANTPATLASLPCRYLCTTCEGEGRTFNLCQDCWDRFQQQEQAASSSGAGGSGVQGPAGGSSSSSLGRLLHEPWHAFQHIGPVSWQAGC